MGAQDANNVSTWNVGFLFQVILHTCQVEFSTLLFLIPSEGQAQLLNGEEKAFCTCPKAPLMFHRMENRLWHAGLYKAQLFLPLLSPKVGLSRLVPGNSLGGGVIGRGCPLANQPLKKHFSCYSKHLHLSLWSSLSAS